METSEQLNELAAALAKAQAEMTPAIKDKVVKGNFSYAYADLATVIEAAHATLAKHGLAIAAPFETDEHGNMTLVMSLMHTSGQRMVSRYPIMPVKKDPQGIGSAISYARRYAMMSLVNLPTADDDAQAAMGRNDDSQSYPASKRNQHNQTRDQLPETWGGAPKPAQQAKRGPGRPPKQPVQPEPVESSDLFQEVMETLRQASSKDDLDTAAQLAMGLSDEGERNIARSTWWSKNKALKEVQERSEADRDFIKAGLTLPKPA